MTGPARNLDNVQARAAGPPGRLTERSTGPAVEGRWWACVGIVACAFVLLAMYARAATGPPVDFGAYYGAAVALRSGQSPYRDALAWRSADHATGSPGQPPTANIAYVYPPALGLAIVPLTALPLHAATTIWLAVLFGCVLGTAWCLATLVRAPRRVGFWLLVAGLTLAIGLGKPVRGALTFSKQVDPLILLLIAGTVAAFARRRDTWAGLLLGLAITIKPFVVVLALVPIWKGAYRLAAVAGLVAALFGLGPLLAFGLLGDFLAAAGHWGGPTMAASPVGQSAYSLLLRTLTAQPYTVPLLEAPWLVIPLHGLLGLALVGLVLAVVSRSREQPSVVVALEFGLVIAAMLIFGPLTEEHHLAYLVIGLAATLAAGLSTWSASPAARRITVLTTALIVFLVLPGTHVVAWGFYGYQDGPIAPPLAFATFLWLAVILVAGALNLDALRQARRWPSHHRSNATSA